MTAKEDDKMLTLIEQLSKHIDTQFENTTKILHDIKKSTEENTKHIAELQVKVSTIDTDIKDMKIRETDQHKEFYSRITKLETQIERLKTIVTVVGSAIGIIVSIVAIILK